MMKHVGTHKGKRIILLFREVPGEEHMCLVSYSDSLPSLYHDNIMKILEGSTGQQAKSFSDVLHRNILPDGRNALEALHADGLIKKVQTSQVTITPNNNSKIQLDELNTILDEMEKGEAATKRLQDIERAKEKAARKKPGRDLGEPVQANAVVEESIADVLSDSQLARDRLQQANRMRADAARLLQEAEVLETEAKSLDPNLNAPTTKKKATKTKKD